MKGFMSSGHILKKSIEIRNMGKHDSTIKFAEEQVKRMKDQISLYKKFKNPGWEAVVESCNRQIRDKQKAIADMKKRDK